MAERSKAPVSGTGLFGGVGSNPTPIRFIVLNKLTKLFLKKSAETGNRTQASAATMQGTAIILSQHLLSMMHERESLGQGCDSKYFSHQGVAWNWCESATLAKRLMRLPRKQKVVSSNLTSGSFFSNVSIFQFLFLAMKKISSFWTSQWPNWIRRLTTNQEIGGSSPSWDIFFHHSEQNFVVASKNAKPRSTGFEPATPRFEVWCAIHCATSATFWQIIQARVKKNNTASFKNKIFRVRELNPGLLGESQLS